MEKPVEVNESAAVGDFSLRLHDRCPHEQQGHVCKVAACKNHFTHQVNSNSVKNEAGLAEHRARGAAIKAGTTYKTHERQEADSQAIKQKEEKEREIKPQGKIRTFLLIRQKNY